MSDQTPKQSEIETQIAFIVDILERGNDVREWPADEAAAYREFRFAEGWAAVNRVRAQKIIDFVNNQQNIDGN